MKKIFKLILAVYSAVLLSVYLKLLPNPSNFFITRDTILTRRERGFWQFSFIPFASYFHIGENFPTNLWLIFGHIGLAVVWGVLLALALKNLTVKNALCIHWHFSSCLRSYSSLLPQVLLTLTRLYSTSLEQLQVRLSL